MNNEQQINPTVREWRIVEAWANARLAEYRRRNDSLNLDDRNTTHLRGRIAELKELLALGQPTPERTRDADAPRDWESEA